MRKTDFRGSRRGRGRDRDGCRKKELLQSRWPQRRITRLKEGFSQMGSRRDCCDCPGGKAVQAMDSE
jgi:hypothetical protein